MSTPKVGRKMEILLAEDSPIDARLTIGALNRGDLQHRLTLVRDGEEALKFLHREDIFHRAPHPDLILLDLLMPKRDGLEVLDAIRDNPDLNKIPVVVLTADESSQAKQECEAHGVKHFITKPVKLDKFLAIVRELRTHWRNDLILPPSVDGDDGGDANADATEPGDVAAPPAQPT